MAEFNDRRTNKVIKLSDNPMGFKMSESRKPAKKSTKIKKHEHEWDEDPQPNNWGDYGPLNCEVPGCKARLHNWEPGPVEPGQKSNIVVEGK